MSEQSRVDGVQDRLATMLAHPDEENACWVVSIDIFLDVLYNLKSQREATASVVLSQEGRRG